jgi:hypothetical protein
MQMWEAKSCFYKNFEYLYFSETVHPKNISIIDFISQNYAKLRIDYSWWVIDWKLVEARNFCHIGFLKD